MGGQVGGRAESRQVRATGDRTTKSEADGRLFFNPATKFEALVNRSVAVAGRAAPQSISAGGVDAQKGPPQPWPVWSRFNWGRGHDGGRMGGAPPLWSATDFSRLAPRPEAQQEISGALARAATAYNFGTPAPPPPIPPNSVSSCSHPSFSALQQTFPGPRPYRHRHPLDAALSTILVILPTQPTRPPNSLQLSTPPCRARPRTRPSSPPSLSRPHHLRPPQS